jgi:hypothetical protein
MALYLFFASLALGYKTGPISDLSVNTRLHPSLEVMRDGVPLSPWDSFALSPLIEDSSYLEFMVKADSPHNVSVLGQSASFVGMVPLVFLDIPDPEDRDKVHVIQEFTLGGQDWQSFYVYFSCMRPGVANVTIEITEVLSRSRFNFAKTCADNEIRSDLSVWIGDDPVFFKGELEDAWREGSMVFNGSLTFSLSIDQGNQFFEGGALATQLDCDVRGPGAVGGYLTSEPIDVSVLVKECRTAKVTLNLRMPPYDTLRLTWKNHCEAPVQEIVAVAPGVDLQFLNETARLNLNSNSTLLKTLSPQLHSVTFALTSTERLPLSKPLLTFKQ